ncbi:hypothetical protein MJD09_27180 [bacterium]|nr:hypothetical protein [bacterium]
MNVSIELPVQLERTCQPEVIKNIFWVDNKILSAHYAHDDNRVIQIEYDGDNLPEAVKDHIKETAFKIANSLGRSPKECILDQTDLVVPFSEDPLAGLEAGGSVQPLFKGGHAYSGLFLKLMNGLDRVFREYALGLVSQEYSFPSLLSYNAAKRCRYLENYPQNVNLVSHIHEDLENLRNFRDTLNDPAANAKTCEHIDPPDLILSPTICYHFWQSLADRQHTFDSLQVGTAAGACHRFESRATTGLERLREFNMREIFAIGSKKEVAEFRDILLQGQIEFLQRFQIAARIETASDPFFVDTSEKRTYQLGLSLKHEVNALLPYKDELLAIGSVNNHETFFSQVFNIQSIEQIPLHSCCLGFGLDRWCLVIFAQFGLEPRDWPATLQELLV